MAGGISRDAPAPEGEVLEFWTKFRNTFEEAKGAVGGEGGDVAADEAHDGTWAAVQGLGGSHLAGKVLIDLLVCLVIHLGFEHGQLRG